MTDALGAFLGWFVPAVVVFGVAAIALAVIAWAIRRARRSPRALGRAEEARIAAGSALVRLDDAVDELDLEVSLSDALYGGTAPAELRRARMTAGHARDRAFAEYADLTDAAPPAPAEAVRRANAVEARARDAVAAIERARDHYRDWLRTQASAPAHVEALRERADRLQATIGDPDALVAELVARYDEGEWRAPSDAADRTLHALRRAIAHLDAADAVRDDPTRTALPDLAEAERALRTAEEQARALEESHRLVTQAALALPGEFEAAREEIRTALASLPALPPDAGARLGAELRTAQDALDALEPLAERRPTETVARIARLHDRLDLAQGDARTAQERLRGARTALPGTLASARRALAHAEVSVGRPGTGPNARVRLAAARDELARARQASDPVEALDIGRRALRHAEDAASLADYDHLPGGAR
jgi:DNA repair exonuclease SbcCD ATPase subunit